jgi:hypothetical protein
VQAVLRSRAERFALPGRVPTEIPRPAASPPSAEAEGLPSENAGIRDDAITRDGVVLSLRRKRQGEQCLLFDFVRFGAAAGGAGAGTALDRHHMAIAGDAFEARNHIE